LSEAKLEARELQDNAENDGKYFGEFLIEIYVADGPWVAQRSERTFGEEFGVCQMGPMPLGVDQGLAHFEGIYKPNEGQHKIPACPNVHHRQCQPIPKSL
jgi:hypothetical protein